MTDPLRPVSSGSLLYVPADRPPDGLVTGFLFPTGSTPPATVSIADALAAQGWFVIGGAVADAAVPAFVAAAQTWFAASARTGALLSWFTNAAHPGAGLSGWTIYAGPGASRSPLSGTASIQFGNFAIGLPAGTTVAATADGAGLGFAAGAFPLTLAVTPFGVRRPVTFPVVGALQLNIAGPVATRGCAAFGFTSDAAGLDSLDVGLRSYSAPTSGGYAQTARHKAFDFGGTTVTLAATLDPLAPTDHDRSALVPAAGTRAASFYRSAAGPAWQATFGDGFRFVLAARLTAVDAQGQPIAGSPVYTLVPSGTVDLALPSDRAATTATGLQPTLMGGLSPVEYFASPATTTLAFVPDQPAFAPTLAPTYPGEARTFGPLTGAATTAWASIVAPNSGTAYFSQPDQAVMHQGSPTDSTFLSYLPQQISALPQGTSAPVPMMTYGAITTGPGISAADLARFERQVWSPQRLATLRPAETATRADAAAPANAPQPPPGAAPNPTYGTTKQGLLLKFDASGTWTDLTLAMSSPPPPAPRSPGLILEAVTGDLQAALQANELFLVASSGDKLLSQCDTAYVLSRARVDGINARIPDAACQQWLVGLVANGAVAYAGLAALRAAVLATGAPPAMAGYFDVVRTYAADFSLFAAGAAGADAWEFDLSPRRWNEHRTILIFKFCNKTLAQAAVDPSQWSGAASFNDNPAAMAQEVATIIADTRTRAKSDTDLAYFVDTVLDDPSWNGIVALNALVPLAGLPEQMRALAAGIDPAAFKAHHVGVSVTPVTPGATAFVAKPSSIFGLIDYEDPAPLQSGDPYAFKVDTLKVLIANSQVAGFSSRVELLVNTLFGEPATQIGASGNALAFDGYYQKSGGSAGQPGIGTYRFVTNAPTAYSIASRVLDQVAITGATFVTLPGTDDQHPTVNSRFQLDGAIAFLPQSGFDLFSYGPEQVSRTIEQGLAYRSLAIEMTFDEATPTYRTFAFDAAALVVDAATSTARAVSLVSHFPMKLTALVQGVGDVTPDSLGFMPVDMPIQGSTLAAPWFGLRFDLDLGTPGALAAATGFDAGLLLAWAPAATAAAGATIYCGLSLPGVSGGQRAISLEGVISLVFGGIRFVVAPPTYLIQLSNIALKFLSLSFPPNGQVNMTLFGNPAQQTSGALGWFAAYLKNGAAKGGGTTQPRLPEGH